MARPRSLGITAMSAFFAFGAFAAGLSAVALLFPHSAIDQVWRLNPGAKSAFLTIGPWAVLLMIVVAIACGLSAVGLWTRAIWGRQAAVLLLSANLIGDVVNAGARGDWRTLIGVPIGGAMIAYLLTERTRGQFHPKKA